MATIEHNIQRSVVTWFRLQYRSLAPLFFAVPNGQRRSRYEQREKKAEGMVAGVADLKPACREVLELTLDELKKTHQECVAGTCKRFSLVQRQFVRMMIESSLRAEIKALKRNQENNE